MVKESLVTTEIHPSFLLCLLHQWKWSKTGREERLMMSWHQLALRYSWGKTNHFLQCFSIPSSLLQSLLPGLAGNPIAMVWGRTFPHKVIQEVLGGGCLKWLHALCRGSLSWPRSFVRGYEPPPPNNTLTLPSRPGHRDPCRVRLKRKCVVQERGGNWQLALKPFHEFR